MVLTKKDVQEYTHEHHHCCSLTIKHTSDCDSLTLFGFVGRVGAHTVVFPLVLSSDIGDLVGSFQFLGGLGIEGAVCLSVVPGEADGKRASLNGAHQSHVLPLRDVPHAGKDAQHWFRHRLCIENIC